jgi:hypothetical protein
MQKASNLKKKGRIRPISGQFAGAVLVTAAASTCFREQMSEQLQATRFGCARAPLVNILEIG